MTIEEKMARNEVQDQIEIGEIAERIAKGNAGLLMKCLMEAIQQEKIQEADIDSRVSPDRVLGYVTAFAKLKDRLDQCVEIKNQLLADRKEESEVKSGEAPQG